MGRGGEERRRKERDRDRERSEGRNERGVAGVVVKRKVR